MRARLVFLSAVFFLGATAIPAAPCPTCSDSASKSLATPRPRPKTQRKIFTNEVLEELESKSPVTAPLEAPAVEAAAPNVDPPAARSSTAAIAKIEPYVKERDLGWYRGQFASLRAELERIDRLIRRLREFRATGRGMMSGIVLGEPGLRLTPENEIEQLGLHRRELQRQIDELEDTARRSDIEPGFLLASSPYVTSSATQSRPQLTPEEVDELEKQRTEVEAQLTQEKVHLEFAKKELELVERDDVLFRQQFYSNPGYTSDHKGRAQLAVLASELSAKREEVSVAQNKIEAFQEELQTLERAMGPKPAGPLTPEQQREAWQDRLRPLREQLARVEAELARMRADTATRGLTLYPETSSGSPTSILLRRLETRAATLRQQIEAVDEEAHRAGIPPGWLR